jgi:hypothetical protein
MQPSPRSPAQIKSELQHITSGHDVAEQSLVIVQLQEALAIALFGAASDATIGNAIIEARPIFLMASRRDWPENDDLISASSNLFRFNWSIASQTRSSETLLPVCVPTKAAMSVTELLPSQAFQTIDAVRFKQ